MAATAGPLDLAPDATLDPELQERLIASPMGYFRFVNVAFGGEVCRRFAPHIDGMRTMNLHGDAHVEQYAVTDAGRGLTDFDDAASGPAVLDLVRFSTSLLLTCRDRGWDDASPQVLDAFYQGYRAALEDPSLAPAPPVVVGRVHKTFEFDPKRYFDWLTSVTEPIAPADEASVRAALGPYAATKLATDAALTPDYFQVQSLGASRMGIGSTRFRKYLVRVRGPSDAPEDDDVLELKEIGDLSGVTCLTRGAALDPQRLLIAQARIAYQPYRLVGYVLLDRKPFWVHAWAKSYHEMKPQDFQDATELAELARDVGVQLGLGHPKLIAAPFDRELRRDGRLFLDQHERDIVELSKAMRDEVIAAWTRFKSARAH